MIWVRVKNRSDDISSSLLPLQLHASRLLACYLQLKIQLDQIVHNCIHQLHSRLSPLKLLFYKFKSRVIMLMGVFRTMVNNSFYESFDTTFMKKKKKKNVKTLIAFFFFSHKIFFKWIISHYPKSIHQYFPFFNYIKPICPQHQQVSNTCN